MKIGFTHVVVMLATTILVIVVAGFSNVTEKIPEQMQFIEQKTELTS